MKFKVLVLTFVKIIDDFKIQNNLTKYITKYRRLNMCQ